MRLARESGFGRFGCRGRPARAETFVTAAAGKEFKLSSIFVGYNCRTSNRSWPPPSFLVGSSHNVRTSGIRSQSMSAQLSRTVSESPRPSWRHWHWAQGDDLLRNSLLGGKYERKKDGCEQSTIHFPFLITVVIILTVKYL
jgi:hypothetical protein